MEHSELSLLHCQQSQDGTHLDSFDIFFTSIDFSNVARVIILEHRGAILSNNYNEDMS